ncbi:MAG: protoporphyrinogen oxidase [Planctomycetaceae bacterium]
MSVPRVAIVGGGITGLAAAHRLLELQAVTGRKVEIVLIEPAQRLGGVFGTEFVDGYQLETGADMFITDKPWGVDLVRRLGLEDRLVVPEPRFRKSMILRNGRPVETPEAFNLMVPGKLWPIIKTPLLSPWGKLRLMLEPFIPCGSATTLAQDESLADFVRRRLGREAMERIVQPLVGGIYTADPEKLSLDATLPRFRAMEREFGSLYRGMRAQQKRKKTVGGESTPAGQGRGDVAVSGARYGLFVSFQNGMSELTDRLVERVSAGAAVWQGRGVARVEREGTRYRLWLTSSNGVIDPTVQKDAKVGESSREAITEASELFDAVVVAVPSHRAATMFEVAFPELAGELQKIEYASSAVVVTAHRDDQIEHPLDCYGLVVPQIERRRILAVSVLTKKFPQRGPAGRTVLRTFIGGALQPELMDLSDDELRRVVREELASIFGVHGEPELCRVVRYSQGMPQYHVGHQVLVRRIESLVAKERGIWVCGKAYRGVGIPDCIHDGEQAGEGVWETLFPALENPAPVA